MLHNVSGLPATTTWWTASASLLEWNKDVSFLLLITHATGWLNVGINGNKDIRWTLTSAFENLDTSRYQTAIQKKLLRKNLKTNLFPENFIYSGCAQMTFWGVFIHPLLFLFLLCCCSMHIFALYKSSSSTNTKTCKKNSSKKNNNNKTQKKLTIPTPTPGNWGNGKMRVLAPGAGNWQPG